MDAVHCEFCLFALYAWHHQHLCMSACIPDPWATYSKQLTGHELHMVRIGQWLFGSGAHPPQGVGGVPSLGDSPPWGGWEPSSLGDGQGRGGRVQGRRPVFDM